MYRKAGMKIAASVLMAALLTQGGCFKIVHYVASDPLAKIESFAENVGSIQDIDAPDGARIIGFGEAAHGNKEFQRMKLDVFKEMVEKEGVRCFALEADMAGCFKAENYTLRDQGSSEEATRAVGFSIYRTDEIKQLLEWIHDYNQGKEDSGKIRFMGFDNAYGEDSVLVIKEFYETNGLTKASDFAQRLDTYFCSEYGECTDSSKYSEVKALVEEIISDLKENESSLKQKCGEDTYEMMVKIADGLSFYLDRSLSKKMDSSGRDRRLAENVTWICDREEKRGSKLFISGHNGHLGKVNTIASQITNMGTLLAEEYGDAYYVIGSDYYESNCSFPGNNKREDHKLCSDDPLAFQVSFLGTNECYMDFAKVDRNSEVYKYVSENMTMGSLGEQYSIAMDLMSSMRAVNAIPAKMYDGMIFVYEATPIEVWPAN